MATISYNDLFTHHEVENNIITYYAKKDVEWDNINTFLEHKFGEDGKNPHWKWRGFMIDGRFQVVVVKKPCSDWICECEECDECGTMSCELNDGLCPICVDKQKPFDCVLCPKKGIWNGSDASPLGDGLCCAGCWRKKVQVARYVRMSEADLSLIHI